MQEKIIKKLSEKYNLPEYHIQMIIEAPFRVFSEELEKVSLKGFICTHLGKFIVPPHKQIHIREHKLDELMKQRYVKDK